MRLQAILFDFDGTLADTNDLVMASWQHTFQTLRGQKAPEELIYATFGEPLITSMERIFPEVSPADAVAIYRAYQRKVFSSRIKPFPGMVEALLTLKDAGLAIAIVTSRLRSSTWKGLESFGITDKVDTVVTCEDTKKHKPDPEPALIAIRALGVRPEEALFAGDTVFDTGCAKNAGALSCMVAWTPALPPPGIDFAWEPDYTIRSAEELVRLALHLQREG